MAKTLMEKWRDVAYSSQTDKGTLQRLWTEYFTVEKGVYEKLLSNPDEVVKGTVKELAEKYGITLMHMVGFLDGINDSLKTPNPIEEMDEDTVVSLEYDKELLYKNMVAASADWKYATDEEIAKVRAQLLKEIRLIEDLENAADDFLNYCKIKMEETAN